MKNSSAMSELIEEIDYLKFRQNENLTDLKNHFHLTTDSLKPMNLIKNSFQNVLASPNLKSNIFKSALGYGTTYLSNKFYDENSINPAKRILSRAVKFGIEYLYNKRKSSLLK